VKNLHRGRLAAVAVATALMLAPAGAGTAQAPPPAATLVGFARLPADTFAPGPPSGGFRDNGARSTAFASQPVQGSSAMRPDPDHPGSWFVLSDNGFGVRWNSPDYLLCFYRLEPAWKTERGGPGMVGVGEVTRLSDPRSLVPFRIVREETPERWLTGSDFDPESFVRMPDGTWWIGDEFGPFLLHVDAQGRLLAPPASVPGLVSPDRPGLPPPDAGQPNTVTVRRSRGFEALALAPDGTRLLAMLEGPTTTDPSGQARILEFNPSAGAFTGRHWIYKLDAAANSVTELVPYAPNGFLAIERDGGHGPEAKFKRVFAIHLGEPGALVEKTEVLDLLRIADPHHLGGTTDVFTFPFVTTEAIWAEDDRTLVLSNDNNYPAAGGRAAGERDGTEFVRLRLSAPLR
jgi:glycerophosphoryl diester phosphodiesterase